MASVYGNPKVQMVYFDYMETRSDGSTTVISKTRVELNTYLAIDTSDWGLKALSLHLSRSSGADTYYGDVDCEMKHVDAFADSVVMRWTACASPDTDMKNFWDMNRNERSYYGNRGDKYYNEIWFNVNPAGAQYEPVRGNLETPHWKNPDQGGAPYWL